MSCVRDGQHHITAWRDAGMRHTVLLIHTGGRRLDCELAAFRHRIAGVDGQVHDHLLQLTGIDQHAVETFGQSAIQLDVGANHETKHPFRFAYGFVQIHRFGL